MWDGAAAGYYFLQIILSLNNFGKNFLECPDALA